MTRRGQFTFITYLVVLFIFIVFYTAANDTYTDTLGWFLTIAAGFGMVLLLYRGKLREGRND